MSHRDWNDAALHPGQEAPHFCHAQLGFDGAAFGDRAILRRDVEIHAWLARDRLRPEHAACHLRRRQVAALHAGFGANRVPGLSDFAVRPWNVREFHLVDLHGNLLRFRCIPDAPA